MINENTKQRELAYVVKIDDIQPITGSDNCEAAIVKGWQIMVRKNTYQKGDLAVYFEIDSLVDISKPEFAFLASKKGKIKTQRYTFGGKNPGFYSQGLLMSAKELGGDVVEINDTEKVLRITDTKGRCNLYNEGDFLTDALEVKYYEIEDQKRKAPSVDKYKKMAARHPKLFKNPVIRKIYKTTIGKKILYIFFGKKKDGRNWPSWVIKTDEERIQNMPFILQDKTPWIVTEKIDGTSTTFTIHKGKRLFQKPEFYMCSRNVVFDRPDKQCYYDTNVYIEIAEKYHMEEVLKSLLEKYSYAEYITIQGETYGAGIQKRDYGMKDHDFMAFNLIISPMGRINSSEMKIILAEYGVPCVPILDTNFVLPDTVEELLEFANGDSVIDGDMREGLVFRYPDGTKSFKAVSNPFLIKYHR